MPADPPFRSETVGVSVILGAREGVVVGEVVVGGSVGSSVVGSTVGEPVVGEEVGSFEVGSTEGKLVVGNGVGHMNAEACTASLGISVPSTYEISVTSMLDPVVGTNVVVAARDGTWLGATVGVIVGDSVSFTVGDAVGFVVS